jgi:hypothetical protein
MYSRCYPIGKYTTTVSEQRLGKHVKNTRAIARQLLGKQVPAETNKHVNNIRAIARQPSMTTIEELLETVFSVRSVQNGYKEDNWGDPVQLRE